jgi:Uma2 family endonuclease
VACHTPRRARRASPKLPGRAAQSWWRTSTITSRASLFSPADIEPEAGALVQPDVFVGPLPEGRRPSSWADFSRLLLAVEVVSPSTARADRTVKRLLFQRAGVPEYWIVDLDARLVERWRPGDDRPEVITEVLRWHPDRATAPLEIDLPRLFATVNGD